MRNLLDEIAPDRTVARPGVNLHAPKISYDGNYSTPEHYIGLIRTALGGRIACDPASSDADNRIIKAAVHYTLADDGLAQAEWPSPWMLNSPSLRREEFYARAAAEAAKGAEAVVIAGLKHTCTKYVQPLLPYVKALHIPANRPVFVHPETRYGDESPTDGRIFLYIGWNSARFVEAFSGDAGLTALLMQPDQHRRPAPKIEVR